MQIRREYRARSRRLRWAKDRCRNGLQGAPHATYSSRCRRIIGAVRRLLTSTKRRRNTVGASRWRAVAAYVSATSFSAMSTYEGTPRGKTSHRKSSISHGLSATIRARSADAFIFPIERMALRKSVNATTLVGF